MPFVDDPTHPLSEANFDKLLDQSLNEILAEDSSKTGLEEAGLEVDMLRQQIKSKSEEFLSNISSIATSYDRAREKIALKEKDILPENVSERGPNVRMIGEVLLVFLRKSAGLIVFLILAGVGIYYAINSNLGLTVKVIIYAIAVFFLIGMIISALEFWRNAKLSVSVTYSTSNKKAAEKKLGLDVERGNLAQLVNDINHELSELIKEQARMIINRGSEDNYSLVFSIKDAPGLSEVFDNPRRAIDTRATKKLRYMLENMNGGSIGIAGSRGAGKSTLIQMCCGEKRVFTKLNETNVLPVLTSAPVQYDSRDFILYLFSSTCQKALEYYGDENVDSSLNDEFEASASAHSGLITLILSLISVFMLAAGGGLVMISLVMAFFLPPASPAVAGRASNSNVASVNANINANAADTNSLNSKVSSDINSNSAGANTSEQEIANSNTNTNSTDAQSSATPLSTSSESTAQTVQTMLTNLEIKAGLLFSWGVPLLVLGFAISIFLRMQRENDFPKTFEDYKNAREEIRERWLADATASKALNINPFSRDQSVQVFRFESRLKSERNDSNAVIELGEGENAAESRSPEEEFRKTKIRRTARKLLRDMRFQQSYTSGWSGAIKLPAGFEGGVNSALTFAQKQMSNPEIVDKFKRFIGSISNDYRVIIGIDELDKIESDKDAQKFLNEIKSIFGLQNCFYLISVSENAMSNFERRGLPFRDVFDSSFDNVVYVDYLNHQDARSLLIKRIIGKPVPFIYLSYCLSGGLARDLIRSFRNLVEIGRDLPPGSKLPEICRLIAQNDINAKIRAIIAQCKKVNLEIETSRVISLLNDLESKATTPAAFLENCQALYKWEVKNAPAGLNADKMIEFETKAADVRSLVKELGAYYYFLGTILEFFGDKLSEDVLKKAQAGGDLEVMAKARQNMSVDSSITIQMLNKLRKKWKMKVPLLLQAMNEV